MFENTKAFSGFAVDDLGRAREFYEGTLGIRVSEEPEFLTLHLADGRDTLVYRKPDFTPATYTILNFIVDDVETAVDELSARGVRVRALRGLRPGREGHRALGRRSDDRLVHGSGREHPERARDGRRRSGGRDDLVALGVSGCRHVSGPSSRSSYRAGRQNRLPGVRPSQAKPGAETARIVVVKQPPARRGRRSTALPAAPVVARPVK